MRETRTWEQMRRDNIGAAWIEPSGEFCTQYSRSSISDEVNTFLDEQRAAGFEEWQLVGFNGCWSCDRCIECHFAKPQPLTGNAAGEVKKRAKYKIAEIGSVFAPIKKVYGTITNNPYGKRYNTTQISIMLYSEQFWHYWEIKAKQEGVYFELYADKEV